MTNTVKRRLPITIVPTRKMVNEKEQDELNKGLQRVTGSITELQSYSERLKVRPQKRTATDVHEEAKKLRETVELMKLSSLPIIGERYGNEVELIDAVLKKAEAEAKKGNIVEANRLIQEAKAKIVTIGKVFEIEMKLLISGQPENIRVPGMDSADAFNAVLDGVEAALVDIGTGNEKRGRRILAVAERLANNAYIYNIDTPEIRAQRDMAFLFIIERGNDAKAGKEYTAADAKKDDAWIASFERNVPEIRKFMFVETVQQLREWQQHLLVLAGENRDETLKRAYTKLHRDIERLLKKLEETKKLDLEEFREVASRYNTITGTEQPATEQEAAMKLFDQATELRGKIKKPKEESREWFAQKALDALQQGRNDVARLAILMASLHEGKKHLASFNEIKQVIEGSLRYTPGMASRYARELEVAIIDSELDRIEKGASGKKEPVSNAVRSAKAMMREGKITDAKKLLDMIIVYTSLLEEKRHFEGSEEMEEAIRLEAEGKDGSKLFQGGLALLEFREAADKLRSETSSWGKKKFISDALKKAEDFAARGKTGEARQTLTLLVMYAQAMQRIGTGTVPGEFQENVTGMEEAVLAGNQKAFMENYSAAQNASVEKDAARLEKLPEKRAHGKETIMQAVIAARKRAEKGDFAGAARLLGYVEDYYGKAGKGKAEGWRYRIAAGNEEGFVAGRTEMLEGIRMELVATTFEAHIAAGQRFDSGTRKIGATRQLILEFGDIQAKFMGRKAYEEGHPKGKIPLGTGAEAGYLDLEQVRKSANFRPLMEKMESAAKSGNITEFNRTVDAFNDRIQAVAESIVTNGNVAKAKEQVVQVEGAARSILIMYGKEMGTEARQYPAHANVLKLRERARDMEGKLKKGEFSPEQYASLLADVEAERSRAQAVAVIGSQISLNENYRKITAGAGGEVGRRASESLKKADAEFREARVLIMKGDMEGARKAYERGVNYRSDAILVYRAERSPGSAALKVGGRRTRIGGVDSAGFPQYQAAARMRELDFYRGIHMEAFDALVAGTAGEEQIGRIGRITMLVEASVFSIPQQANAQFLTDFANDQNSVITALRAAAMSGDPVAAERSLKIAEDTLGSMQRTMEANQFTANATLCITALGSAFIPVVGPYVSGGIFTGMAIDQIAMEYRMDGRASATSWAMLGLTVASVGLLAGATRFSKLALSAKALGATEHAAGMTRIAQGMNFANLGIAGTFMVSGGYHAYHAFSEGDYANGVLMTGMVLFPLAMTGIGFASNARLRSKAQREAVLHDLAPEIGTSRARVEEIAPVKSTQEIATTQKLFEFLIRLNRANEAGRAKLLSELPSAEAAKVSRLLENKGVLAAVESGGISEYAIAALGRTIRTFDISPPPSGPRGKRADRDVSVLVNSREALREFVRKLLIPDDAPAHALNERASARAQLEAIRQKSARAGLIIDELVGNRAVRMAIETGNDSAFSNRALEIAVEGRPKGSKAGPERPGLRQLVPDEAVAAEAQAQQAYQMDLAVGAEHVARGAGVEGRTVGMAEATKPPTQAEPAARPPPQEVVQITAPERAVRYVRGRVQQWRANKSAQQKAAGEPPNIQSFSRTARQALEDTIGFTVEESSVQAVIDRATTGSTHAEAAELGHLIRTAPQRLGYLMKSLHQRATEKGAAPAEKEAARTLMAKLYSHENVRRVLEGNAANDPQLARALGETELTISGAARRAGITRENFMSSNSRQGFGEQDVIFIVKVLEAETAVPVSKARLQLIETETNTIPKLHEELAAAKPGSKAATRIKKQLQEANARAGELRAMIHDESNQPLAMSESIFGRRFTQTERASIMVHLMDSGIIQGDAILTEAVRAANMTSNLVASLEVPTVVVKGEKVPNPVALSFRRQLVRRIGENGIKTADDAVLATLRSAEMAASVRKSYGAEAEAKFTKAVKEGSLDEVMMAMENASLPVSMEAGLKATATAAREYLAGDFMLLDILGTRSQNVVAGVQEGLGIAGARMVPLRRALLESWPVASVRKIAGFGKDVFLFAEWKAWATARDTLRTTRRGEAPYERFKARGMQGLQLAIWGAQAYYLAKTFGPGVIDIFTNASSIEEGIATAKRDYGIEISRENAGWMMSREGREFYYTLNNSLPAGSTRRPGSREAFEATLQKGGMIYDPYRLNEILADGKEMEGKLSKLNGHLAKGETAEATEILRGWGIGYEKIGDRKELTMADLVVMRTDDWRKRGLVVSYGDVVAVQFCVDAGIIPAEEIRTGKITGTGLQAFEFLKANPDVFAFLWEGVQKGHIPVAYLDDAIGYMQSGGTLSALRALAEGKKLDSVLQDALIEKGLYLASPIRQISFLGILEREGEYETVGKLLMQYGSNSSAMKAFNDFVPKAGEAVYGNHEDMARLIIDDPDNALKIARERGWIAPRSIMDLAPELRQKPELVTFILEHSAMEEKGKQGAGIMRWLQGRQGYIVDTAAIIEYVRSTGAVDGMEIEQISEYLDRQAPIFREKGWWKGLTPAEGKEKSEYRREAEAAPVQKVKRREDRARAEILEEETTPRYPRTPGFEGEAVKEREQEPAATLTPQGRTFYEREQGLTGFIDARIDIMFDDKGPNGMQMRARYGNDREKAREEIRGGIYRLLTSSDPKDAKARDAIFKADARMAEQNVEVTTESGKFTYNSIMSITPANEYIFEFVRQRNLRDKARGAQ